MVKVLPNLSVSGALPKEFSPVKDVFFKYASARNIIEELLTSTLSTATALDITLRVKPSGPELVDNTDATVGVDIQFNDIKNVYELVAKKAFGTFAVAAEWEVAANILETTISSVVGKLNSGVVFGTTESSTAGTGTGITNITGVTLSSAMAAALGDYTLTYNTTESIEQPTNTTGVVLSVNADPSIATGDYTLAYTAYTSAALSNVTGVTITDVTGIDSIDDLVFTVYTAGSLTNVTGVVITDVKGIDATEDLVYTLSGTLLSFGGGTGVDVSSNGDYILVDLAGTTSVYVTVTSASLPAGDKTDTAVALTVATLAYGGGTAVAISADGDYVLIDLATTTTVSVTVVYSSLDLSDATDAAVALTVATLAIGGGAAVATTEDGVFALTASDTVVFSATVTYASLPATDTSDVDLAVTATGSQLKVGTGVYVDISAGGTFVIEDENGYKFTVVVVTVSLPTADTTDTLALTKCNDLTGNILISVGNAA